MYNKSQLEELEEGWFYYDHAWLLLHHLIKQIVGKSVLDVGCGTGMALSIIKATKPFLTIRGLEPSSEAQSVWDARSLNVVIGSATSIPFEDRQFDTVISSHVIEHIDDHLTAVREIVRVSSSRAIIVVPCGDVDLKNPGSPHLRYYNRQNFRSLIQEAVTSESFNCYSLPHPHINNHIAIIDK